MCSKSKIISIRNKLNSEFPFRNVQIDTLCNLLIEDDAVLPSCIFLHGLPSTGKTSLITRLLYLIRYSVKSSIVNSVCCYTNRYLFEPILKNLLYKKSDIPTRCDNFLQFLYLLNQSQIKEQRVILVLDKCEMLEHEQILLFSKLQELIKSYTFCVIFISQVSPVIFDEDIDFISILFEQYNSAEINEILLIDKPNDWSIEVYKNFLTIFVGSFYGSCRDLVELKHLAKILFIKYIEPIQAGLCSEINQNLLFRKLSPTIQLLLNNVYLGTNLESVDCLSSNEETKFEKFALDLPYYAKYFLISAYIASFNSPKYDRQLFVKISNKRKKNKQTTKKSEKNLNELIGPKSFSLDRLLAIFYAIIEENTNMTANLLAQINTLADLGLLIRLGDGKLDNPKYKCSVNFECVNNIARTVKFNINKYLIEK